MNSSNDFFVPEEKRSCIWQFIYIIKSLILSVLKIRNIKTLLYRLGTVAIVCYYYYAVEKINYDSRVHNEYDLLAFILIWHIVSMNFKIFERTRIKKNPLYKEAIVAFGIILSVTTVLFMIVVPILAAYNV